MQKAESDYRVALVLAREAEPFRDEQCFHCQQSAEKYLKALLVELKLPAPRTHLLKDLLSLLTPHHPNLGGFPGDKASKRQAAAAMRWAGKVRVACRQLLGLRSR